ncbi:unnamed protein product [Rotaria sp. Silwood2]|nr:unnamed protein product [Rotaria sp. Silwood2]
MQLHTVSNMKSQLVSLKTVVLWRYMRGELNNSSENKAQTYDVTRIITLDDHGSTVWKVCWNVFGSVLYSCGDDGRIRMWKGTINGPWKCESNVSLQAEALEKAKSDASQSTEPVSS